MNIQTIENKYQLKTYHKLPLTLVKGKGVYVWDINGKQYLDFYGGHAVALIGHCHPEIVKSVNKQIKKLIFYSNVVFNPERAIAAKKLIEIAPKTFSSVFFCNSGTEANETALKLAKKFTGKDEVISFKGSFHGRTIGSLSVTGIDKYQKTAGALLSNVKFAELGNVQSVQKLISQKTAAIIVEPIQSIAGLNEAKPQFYLQLKQIALEKKLVLIFDEVQTGLGRTGKMFYGDHIGVVPDLITLAKGIAGGLPAGVVLVTKKISQSVALDDQGSTFGGGPLISSAITSTIDIITKNHLIKKVAKLSQYLMNKLIQLPHVVQIKGKGFLLGIEFDIPAKNIQDALLKNNIITGTAINQNILRIMPPLIINKKGIDEFLSSLECILKKEKL